MEINQEAIAFQAPKYTFGDALMVCHVAYNNYLNSGKKIVLAVPKEVNGQLRELYNRQKFLIIENYETLPEPNNDEDFISLCKQQNWEPNFFFQTTKHYKNIKYINIEKWMRISDLETKIPFSNYVIVHVTSSANFQRPIISNFYKHLENIKLAGYRPVILGTQKDEETALKNYPDIKNYFQEDECWRFGMGTIFDKMADIKHSSGVFSFSSWSSIFSSLMGIPTLEVWNWDQWQHFNFAVKMSLGNPMHLFQIPYNDSICHNYFLNSFRFANFWKDIY